MRSGQRGGTTTWEKVTMIPLPRCGTLGLACPIQCGQIISGFGNTKAIMMKRGETLLWESTATYWMVSWQFLLRWIQPKYPSRKLSADSAVLFLSLTQRMIPDGYLS